MFLSSFIDALYRVRNKIMYALSWWTVSALTRVLSLYLFPSLLCNLGNKHKSNPLVSAETVCHSRTYIILYVFQNHFAEICGCELWALWQDINIFYMFKSLVTRRRSSDFKILISSLMLSKNSRAFLMQFLLGECHGAVKQQAITWASVNSGLCNHMMSLGHNGLRHYYRIRCDWKKYMHLQLKLRVYIYYINKYLFPVSLSYGATCQRK